MAEYVHVDLTPVLVAVDRINSRVDIVSHQVSATQALVNQSLNELADLRRQFEMMMDEQRKAAALQRALTEIVRIRQELEKKFGNQQKVRDNMLGILQASDLSIIKEKTISQCSEQLMLACPRYWLAPCLIAITAWMANDRALAERALKEAINRNDENTSLVMALVSRRAGKTQAAYQWLQRYFDMQKPTDMKESILAIIDAYANGIFGSVDEDRCGESIDSWMVELEETLPTFRQDQEQGFKNRFTSIKPNMLEGISVLSAQGVCPEYGRMYEYVSRIRQKDVIFNIFDNIMAKHVNRRQLIEQIDENLEILVSKYEEEEEPLRLEERKMTLIKELRGDEERAEQIMEAETYYDKEVNLADRLTGAIFDPDIPTSTKKTAIVLMSAFIKNAYKEYMTEKAQDYPEEITINLGEVSQRTKKGENVEQMRKAIIDKNEELRAAKLSTVKSGSAIFFGILAVIGLAMATIGLAVVENTTLGIAGIAVFFLGLIFMITRISKNKKKRRDINNMFDERKKNILTLLERAIAERKALCAEVEEFEATEGHDVLTIRNNEEA